MKTIDAIAHAGKAIFRSEKSKVSAYAAVIAAILFEGGYNVRGYAKKLQMSLALEMAKARYGSDWGKLSDEAKQDAIAKASATAKRYADKGTAAANVAAEKGLNIELIHAASAPSEAAKITEQWLVGLGAYNQESLYEVLGFAKNAAKTTAAPAKAEAETKAETKAEATTISEEEAAEEEADPVGRMLMTARGLTDAQLAHLARGLEAIMVARAQLEAEEAEEKAA